MYLFSVIFQFLYNSNFVAASSGLPPQLGFIRVFVASCADKPGGPLNSTIVVGVYQWQVAFNELRLGYGSAMGVVLFVIVLVITLLQSQFLRRR